MFIDFYQNTKSFRSCQLLSIIAKPMQISSISFMIKQYASSSSLIKRLIHNIFTTPAIPTMDISTENKKITTSQILSWRPALYSPIISLLFCKIIMRRMIKGLIAMLLTWETNIAKTGGAPKTGTIKPVEIIKMANILGIRLRIFRGLFR